jgi:hypothetical protein
VSTVRTVSSMSRSRAAITNTCYKEPLFTPKPCSFLVQHTLHVYIAHVDVLLCPHTESHSRSATKQHHYRDITPSSQHYGCTPHTANGRYLHEVLGMTCIQPLWVFFVVNAVHLSYLNETDCYYGKQEPLFCRKLILF